MIKQRQRISLTDLDSPYLEIFSVLLVMPERASVVLHGQEAELALCLWATANGLVMDKGDGRCRVTLRNGTEIETRNAPHPKPASAPRVTVDQEAVWSPADQFNP